MNEDSVDGKVPVVITDFEYQKAVEVFNAAAGFQWIVSDDDESSLSRSIESTGARIAVVGTIPYRDAMYTALSSNGAADGALIARYGVGCDSIDGELCRQENILLCNTPGVLDVSVAEHALALLLAVARQVPRLDKELHDGGYAPVPGFELAGKTLGIAGFGSIGKRLAGMVVQGLGMRVSAYDAISLKEQCRLAETDEAEFRRRYGLEMYTTDFAEFAGSTNLISVHMPVLPETIHYFDAGRLGVLKKGSVIINTSRGALIDEGALHEAVSSGHLRGAALDVYENEPYEPVSPDRDLRKLGGVILTPHVASSTLEANRRIASAVVANVTAFLEKRLKDLSLAG